jgi:hypothetical protein
MTRRTPAGPRIARGPVRAGLLTALAAAALVVPGPAHAAGPLDALCVAYRSATPQTLSIVAYARVSPGDVAARIAVECTVTGDRYGYQTRVASTSLGAAVVATGAAILVGADTFRICYRADATFVGGGTAELAERCYSGSPLHPDS